MTDASTSTPAKSESITAPLVLWLIIQLLALGLASSRTPLSAHYPEPAEFLALQMMALVQTIALAMLSPLLLRSLTSALAIALTAAPMLQLAGVLAQAPFARVVLVWLNVTTFLAALALWHIALRRRGTMWLLVIANLLTLGGVVVAYLRAEFADRAPIDPTWWSPGLAAISLARGDALHPKQWMIVVTMCIAGVIAAAVARRSGPSSK